MPARSNLRLVQLAVALSVLAAACRSEPASTEELLDARSLGLGYLRRDRLPEAEEQFRRIVQLAPREPFGYANLGLTYLRAGRFAEAETNLRRARDLDQANVDIALTMAKLFEATGRRNEARQLLEQMANANPREAKVLYALAELAAPDSTGAVSTREYEQRLRQVLELDPANLAVRLQLVRVLATQGEADSAVRHLEEVRRMQPEPPEEARAPLATSIDLLRAGRLADARPALDRFLHLMELTAPYQAALDGVKWVEGPLVGRPVLTFTPQSVIELRGRGGVGPIGDSVRFVDATSDAGLPDPEAVPASRRGTEPSPNAAAALATADFNGDGTDDVFATFWSAERNRYEARIYRVERYRSLDVTTQSKLALTAAPTAAAVGDFDNDGWLDLYVIGSDGRGVLLRNDGTGAFEDVTARSGTAEAQGAHQALFVDLEPDGDLDLLLVGGARNRVYRNNLDGTFAEVAESMGLAGRAGGRDAAFGDFDGDGRMDLVIAYEEGGLALYRNTGARRFEDATASSGLPTSGGANDVGVSDYDNDGFLDIALTRAGAGAPELWRGDGRGAFARDRRSDGALRAAASLADAHAAFVDVENDGWLDLVVAGRPSGEGRAAYLFHNDGEGTYSARASALPASIRLATGIVPIDVDTDGDRDLLIGAGTHVRLVANEDGNTRLSTQVALVAAGSGSGKNNAFGIGAKLELRAGELYQTRVVTSRVTHFGLGPHLKADVLRIEWPNGVPQTVYFPGTDQDVLELEALKGSCAFVYTWDGQGFRFITDVMWQSALGMPVGIMAGAQGGGTMYAPAGASKEYIRIPGAALQPKDGRYVLQLTEELWETAYADEVKLLTVDRPDSVHVFVDERFPPAGPPQLRLFQVTRPQPPRSAVDGRGADVLAAVREHDYVYVSSLTPTRYQGLVEPHELVLDLGPDAGAPGTLLFLRGWIYPSDASINVALSQQSALKPQAPALEVRDARGRWTKVADIGFPAGKDKTIVIDLAGKFPTADRHVRIRTNMQVYWDHASVAREIPNGPAKVTTLAPVAADLHYRGFSRLYRKGGRYGPHWFAYDDVTRESPWRTIEGNFTRYGDVLPLLGKSDDKFVIMGPGDEATVAFNASSATTIPPGWRRDFLLYTDGWIKDADLNTAFGNTVEPLPFQAITSYPFAPGEAYPTDAEHQRYLREYNTRRVTR